MAFAREGARVIINYPNQQEEENANKVLSEVSEFSDASMTILKADVSDSKQASGMVESIKDRYERIDILVNNAGIATSAPVHEMKDQMWNELISIH